MPEETLDAAIFDFTQAVGLLVRRVRAASATQDLSWSETATLKHLARSGPATTADLARVQGMRPQSMRTIVAALEQAGMVERKAHPTDGRQVYLELTARGAAAHQESADAKRNWLAKAVSQLSEKERESLFAAGPTIRRLAEAGPQ
jgi:DNA-binding MarR family transcriptional regulator